MRCIYQKLADTFLKVGGHLFGCFHARALLVCFRMKVVAVIPARFASQRLPGKPLSDIHGKPMIQWVYERTRAARGIDLVLIATDDERIARAAKSFGAEAVMTDPAIPSGTDRVAAVARMHPADVYVNVQGDEPLMDPRAIEGAVDLVRSRRFEMATVMTPLTNEADLHNNAVVKVITARDGRAIYFSRLPIPYGRPRDTLRGPATRDTLRGGQYLCRRHVGLYVYARETLFRLQSLPPSPLEKAESLEQLRALDNSIAIGTVEVDFVSIGVDTPEELEKARQLLLQADFGERGR